MRTHLTTGEYKKLSFKPIGAPRGKQAAGDREGYKNYYAKRVDANQADIVSDLRKLGFMVHSLHEAGNGVFDLLVSKGGLNFLCEVKDGSKPPSARTYTPKQKRFNFSWQGMRCVLTCPGDCLAFARQVNTMLQQIKAAGVTLSVVGSTEEQYQPQLH